jgi:hypothetical protein
VINYDLFMPSSVLSNFKKIFANSSSGSISLDEIYQAAGLDLTKPAVNRIWLANRLYVFKKHGLATPVYARKNNTHVLDRLQLTEKGKRVLDQVRTTLAIQPIENSTSQDDAYSKNDSSLKKSVEEILNMIIKCSIDHPELKIEYSLRDEVVSVQRVQK